MPLTPKTFQRKQDLLVLCLSEKVLFQLSMRTLDMFRLKESSICDSNIDFVLDNGGQQIVKCPFPLAVETRSLALALL